MKKTGQYAPLFVFSDTMQIIDARILREGRKVHLYEGIYFPYDAALDAMQSSVTHHRSHI